MACWCASQRSFTASLLVQDQRQQIPCVSAKSENMLPLDLCSSDCLRSRQKFALRNLLPYSSEPTFATREGLDLNPVSSSLVRMLQSSRTTTQPKPRKSPRKQRAPDDTSDCQEEEAQIKTRTRSQPTRSTQSFTHKVVRTFV